MQVPSGDPTVRAKRALALVWLLGGALVLAFLFHFDPEGGFPYPPCPFRTLTGLLCPGCGSTRAVYQLVHGNLPAALRLNPLLVASLPIVGWAALSSLVLVVRGRPLPRVLVRPVWIWLLLALILVFWVVRNTPLYPA